MSEISRSSATEYAKNAAGDTITIRDLRFIGVTTNSHTQVFTVDTKQAALFTVGKKVEIKHPTLFTQYEIGTISAESEDGLTITFAAAFLIAYPSGSSLFLVTEKDVIDTTVGDRTEASAIFIENEFRDID